MSPNKETERLLKMFDQYVQAVPGTIVWRCMTKKDILKFERFMDVLAGRLYHRNVMEDATPVTCYSIKDGVLGPAKTIWFRRTYFTDPPEPWYVRFIKWCSGATHRRP